jgi:hypothetical protein
MNFIPVDELPVQRKKRCRKNNGDHLREFLNMKVNYAKMDITDMDYMNVDTAYAATHTMIKFYGFPIKCKMINHELYLINLELEDK